MASGLEGEGAESDPPSPTADLVVVREEVRAVVRLLNDLKAADPEILRLAAWEELDTAEIAMVLAISPDAAKQRLSRARKRLTDMYDATYVDKTIIQTRLLRKKVCGERRKKGSQLDVLIDEGVPLVDGNRADQAAMVDAIELQERLEHAEGRN